MRYTIDVLLPEELLTAERRSRDRALVQEVREEIESGDTPDDSWRVFPTDQTGKPIMAGVWVIQ